MMCQEAVIDIHDLQDAVRNPQTSPTADDGESIPTLADVERQHARATLKRLHGNKVKTAEALQISRGTLYRLLEEEEESDSKTGTG
jgi:DNA-binding NtrC family response regulator